MDSVIENTNYKDGDIDDAGEEDDDSVNQAKSTPRTFLVQEGLAMPLNVADEVIRVKNLTPLGFLIIRHSGSQNIDWNGPTAQNFSNGEIFDS